MQMENVEPPAQDTDDDVELVDVVAEQQRERQAYLEGVRRQIDSYESCAHAIVTVTASLEELSANVERMKASAQQLNALTSGWLAAWKRP